MPEPAQRNSQIIAMAMMTSAVVLIVLAALVQSRTIEIGEEIRILAAAVLGGVGLLDFFIGVLFFRKGQSS